MATANVDEIFVAYHGMLKLSPWMRAVEHPPDKIGVYIATVCKHQLFYRYWDGESWHRGSPNSAQEAYDKRGQLWPECRILFYRGLAEEVK